MHTGRIEKLRLYRHLLRNAAKFPSIKRQAMYETVKRDFRDHWDERNETRQEELVKEGASYLGYFLSWIEKTSWMRQQQEEKNKN